MFHIILKQVVTTKDINRNWLKESAKILLKNVTQIIKNLSMRKRTRTILNYLLNTARKFEIVDDPEEILLNKHSEVISQCRRRKKYKLKTLVSNKKDHDIA